jgi:hypothetical protein
MATQIPIPQNPIGESFVWRDWFQRLSNRVFGSMSDQDSNAVFITGGVIDNTAIGATQPDTGAFTTLKVTTLTGYMKANGASNITAAATIPNTDITGLGTMSTQNTGISATVALAKITAGGTDGSLTVANGIITAYTAPT